ncbi:hypothetical protein PAHAL_6G240400 [Panicum hallii]|uniref:Uncharacterized protein n=1 Tax=Panicum hallii TaxID=206008 RepID=A0A2S3I3A9_9POAL|nr:hypothetical protein PAHAL_6G240400 [Panicum hallii]
MAGLLNCRLSLYRRLGHQGRCLPTRHAQRTEDAVANTGAAIPHEGAAATRPRRPCRVAANYPHNRHLPACFPLQSRTPGASPPHLSRDFTMVLPSCPPTPS